jgi:hypothetical protein
MWWLWVAAAAAKPCALDLQIVLLNAADAARAQAPVAVVDRLSGGLLSTTLGGAMDRAVVEFTRHKMDEALHEATLAGSVTVLPAEQSGRSQGWIYWNPRVGVREPSTLGADQLSGKSMLVVHLDDPRDAAIRVGGESPFVVDVARFLGVDVAERVYRTIAFDRMQGPMAEAGLESLVNTGKGVRCPSPAT